jgi:hypothetical protein
MLQNKQEMYEVTPLTSVLSDRFLQEQSDEENI